MVRNIWVISSICARYRLQFWGEGVGDGRYDQQGALPAGGKVCVCVSGWRGGLGGMTKKDAIPAVCGRRGCNLQNQGLSGMGGVLFRYLSHY